MNYEAVHTSANSHDVRAQRNCYGISKILLYFTLMRLLQFPFSGHVKVFRAHSCEVRKLNLAFNIVLLCSSIEFCLAIIFMLFFVVIFISIHFGQHFSREVSQLLILSVNQSRKKQHVSWEMPDLD